MQSSIAETASLYIAGLQGTEVHWRTRIPTLSQRPLSTETVRKYASALAQFHRWIQETHVLAAADGEPLISWSSIREWFAARVSKPFSGFARPALRLVHGAVAPNDAAWIHLSTMASGPDMQQRTTAAATTKRRPIPDPLPTASEVEEWLKVMGEIRAKDEAPRAAPQKVPVTERGAPRISTRTWLLWRWCYEGALRKQDLCWLPLNGGGPSLLHDQPDLAWRTGSWRQHKTGSERRAYVSMALWEDTLRWRQARVQELTAAKVTITDAEHDLLFLDLHPSGMSSALDRTQKSMRQWTNHRLTDQVWPHLLRHIRITDLAGVRDIGLEALRLIVGHADAKTTARYTHVDAELTIAKGFKEAADRKSQGASTAMITPELTRWLQAVLQAGLGSAPLKKVESVGEEGGTPCNELHASLSLMPP